jgi:hypothetical protein
VKKNYEAGIGTKILNPGTKQKLVIVLIFTMESTANLSSLNESFAVVQRITNNQSASLQAMTTKTNLQTAAMLLMIKRVS